MSNDNLLSLQAIYLFNDAGCSIQTLLGPSKNLKCCLSSDSSEEDGLISDPLQLIDYLVGGASGDSHPVIRLVHDACQDQKKACGCGITTLVCISTYWARGVAKLIHQGIPAPVVFEMFEEALSLCKKTALTSTIPLKNLKKTVSISISERTPPHQPSTEKYTQKSFITIPKLSSTLNSAPSRLEKSGSGLGTRLPNKSRILAYSRHFVADADGQCLSEGKEDTRSQVFTAQNSASSTGSGCGVWIAALRDKLSGGKMVAMQLASRVAEIQLSSMAKRIQQRYVLQHSTLGKEQNCSRVIHGAVVDLHADMVTVATKQHGKQLRVIVVDGDCTPGHTHLGLQKRTNVKSYDPRQIYESSSKVNWLHSCAEVLQKLEVGVVIVGGAVWPSLWEHCIGAGIVVLKGLGRQQMDGMCHITGATPISYLTHCLKRHVGRHSVELFAEEWGWTKPRFIRKGQTDRYFERHYICTIKSIAPGTVVSVLLCGKTKCLVNILEDQFQNCLHKLKLVIEDGYLLPGGGRTEALCVAKLRQKFSELNTELSNTELLNVNSSSHNKTSTDISFAMATSWMGDRTLLACWRPHVYEVCIEGLLEYIARLIMNSSCSAEGHYGAMAETEELVKKIERDVVVQSCEFELLDVAKSKMAAWRRALELLRLLFLSTRSRTTVQKTISRLRPI